MGIQLWQILVLSLLGWIGVYDSLNTKFGCFEPVIAGFITGLIMGNVATGLTVGGTMQLMQMGVHNYGGSTIPDYMSATIISAAFAIVNNAGVEVALLIAVPVAVLLMQLDVLARIVNTFVQHRAEYYLEKRNYRKIEIWNYLGIIPWGLSRALPIFVALFFGEGLVETLINITPQWMTDGFKVAGGLMPALGIGILLRYLPISNFYGYVLIGFFLAAYLSVPMMGVAVIGIALALIHYKQMEKQDIAQAYAAETGQGGFDEDE